MFFTDFGETTVTKKSRLDLTDFEDKSDTIPSPTHEADEVTQYLQLQLTSVDVKILDSLEGANASGILLWWKNQEQKMPTLQETYLQFQHQVQPVSAHLALLDTLSRHAGQL